MKSSRMSVLIASALSVLLCSSGNAQNNSTDQVTKKAKSNQENTPNPTPPLKLHETEKEKNTSNKIGGADQAVSIRVTSLPEVPIKTTKDEYDKVLVWATGALVVVGFCQIFFFWRTVTATRDNAAAALAGAQAARDNVFVAQASAEIAKLGVQATAIGNQASALNAKGALLAAAAARDSAEAAKTSADALINSERAWVLIEISNFPEFQPGPTRVELIWIFPTMRNYGKTPARITRVRGIVKLVPDGKQLPGVPEYTLGQGFDDQINLVLPPAVPMQPRLGLTGQEFIQVREQKVTLYVHGIVDYRDFSGKDRSSAYCYVYVIQGYVIQGGFSPAKSGFYPAFNAPPAYTECT